MSLDFDLSKTSLPRDDDGQLIWTRATERLIFATMGVGINALTDKNAAEFYARVSFSERVNGVPTEFRTTAADVAQHIGLKTNASALTRAQYLKRLTSWDLDSAVRAYPERVESTETAPALIPEGTDR
jgi:hypothetical protein